MSPTRPIASCTVATPNCPSASTASRSARLILRLTTPSSVIASSLTASRLQRLVETRIDAPRVALVDLVALLGAEIARRLDIALGVVIMMSGLRVDPPDRADHFAGEQDIVDRDHLGQQVDARLVIDAGVEEDVLQQLLREQRLLELLREPTITAPVVRRGAAAVRHHEAERRKILEQVALDELHHGGRVGVDVVGDGGMEAGVAAGRDMDHRGDVPFAHLLVDRVPPAVSE